MNSFDSFEAEVGLARVLGFFPHPDDEAFAVAATFKKLGLSLLDII